MQYTEKDKKYIWLKSTKVIKGASHDLFALDYHDNEIHYFCYGNRNSSFGWEIDHIIPEALGGRTIFDNLRAIHWRTNARGGGIISSLLNRV